MNNSLTDIGLNHNLTPLLLIFAIFEHICIITLYVDSNPPLNTLQIMVFKVLVFHENTKLLPSSDSYELYPGNNYPSEVITIILVGIPVRKKIDWVKVSKEDLS